MPGKDIKHVFRGWGPALPEGQMDGYSGPGLLSPWVLMVVCLFSKATVFSQESDLLMQGWQMAATLAVCATSHDMHGCVWKMLVGSPL